MNFSFPRDLLSSADICWSIRTHVVVVVVSGRWYLKYKSKLRAKKIGTDLKGTQLIMVEIQLDY